MVEKICRVFRVEYGEVQSSEIAELSSNQEEVDAKVFLDCKHAEIMGPQHVCIVTVTATLAYAIHFASQFQINLYVLSDKF